MPKHIPDEIKLKAMELFLKGDKTAKQIAEEISTAEHKVAPPTIYMWAKKERWGEQKAVAIAATREMTSLHFDRALDAARAADIGIKGQREVLQGMINLEFVQDIMNILIEEITDQETLQRIGVKLKAIEQKHRDI